MATFFAVEPFTGIHSPAWNQTRDYNDVCNGHEGYRLGKRCVMASRQSTNTRNDVCILGDRWSRCCCNVVQWSRLKIKQTMLDNPSITLSTSATPRLSGRIISRSRQRKCVISSYVKPRLSRNDLSRGHPATETTGTIVAQRKKTILPDDREPA